MFKSDYKLQLKEASAGNRCSAPREKGLESFGEKALFVERGGRQNCPGGGGGTVES